MKKVLLLTVAILMFSSLAIAQNPPQGYIGIFADETKSSNCYEGDLMAPMYMYIWCLPSEYGQMAAEFMVTYPANVITSTVTAAPHIAVSMGDLASGISYSYTECQWDWHWDYKQLMYVTDSSGTQVDIVAHPDVGTYQFSNCEDGFPIEPCIYYTPLYLNVCGPTGTDDASWGAIKGMYE